MGYLYCTYSVSAAVPSSLCLSWCSTCHWCPVMERESFESQETRTLLSRYFVSIKVVQWFSGPREGQTAMSLYAQ